MMLVLGILLFWNAYAMASTKPKISTETFVFSLHHQKLDVRQTVLAPQTKIEVATLTGATHIRIVSGHGQLQGSVASFHGSSPDVLTYTLAFPHAALSTNLLISAPIQTLWVLTPSNLTLPIELNQQFFPDGNTTYQGHNYTKAIAHNVPIGRLPFNLEYVSPLPPFAYLGFTFLALLFLGLAVVAFWRRRPPNALKEVSRWRP